MLVKEVTSFRGIQMRTRAMEYKIASYKDKKTAVQCKTYIFFKLVFSSLKLKINQ